MSPPPFDTVLSFLVHANAVAALASFFRPGVRFLQSVQTTQPRPAWHWRLQDWVGRRAERVVVPSPSVADVAHMWAHVRREMITVIPNAVNVESFATIAGRRRTPVPPFQVGFIGRLDPVKRLTDLLGAMHRFSARRAQLHLFGDGPERSLLEERFLRERSDGRVTFHGAIARPHEALAAIDVLVLPSDAEGFGLVLIEAMAAGVPVVATDVPGIRDVVTNERTGLLVPARRPDLLRGAILRACTDLAFRERVIPAARAEVVRRFSWDSVLPLYRTLLEIKNAPAARS